MGRMEWNERNGGLDEGTGITRAGRAGSVHVAQLERWLCDPIAPVPSLDDLTSVFGLSFDAPTDIRVGALPHRLRFTLAVLRDTFPDDGAARRWLRAPSTLLGGRRPLDLLLAGEIDRLEALAVGAWSGQAEQRREQDPRSMSLADRARTESVRSSVRR
jgi:hypothetical protein